jgi:tRNA acetyltransferase TAN1
LDGVEGTLPDFNLLATTSRGSERQMCNEMLYMLKEELGDASATVGKTGVRGLIAAKTTLDPSKVVEEFRAVLQERPYEFRYALRIIPIEKVVRTNLDEIRRMAAELAAKIGENETFRVTVEKRFTSVHSRDFIEAAATVIQRKADLENPNKILLIEVIGGLTGMSIIKPSDILAVVKEKML